MAAVASGIPSSQNAVKEKCNYLDDSWKKGSKGSARKWACFIQKATANVSCYVWIYCCDRWKVHVVQLLYSKYVVKLPEEKEYVSRTVHCIFCAMHTSVRIPSIGSFCTCRHRMALLSHFLSHTWVVTTVWCKPISKEWWTAMKNGLFGEVWWKDNFRMMQDTSTCYAATYTRTWQRRWLVSEIQWVLSSM